MSLPRLYERYAPAVTPTLLYKTMPLSTSLQPRSSRRERSFMIWPISHRVVLSIHLAIDNAMEGFRYFPSGSGSI